MPERNRARNRSDKPRDIDTTSPLDLTTEASALNGLAHRLVADYFNVSVAVASTTNAAINLSFDLTTNLFQAWVSVEDSDGTDGILSGKPHADPRVAFRTFADDLRAHPAVVGKRGRR